MLAGASSSRGMTSLFLGKCTAPQAVEPFRLIFIRKIKQNKNRNEYILCELQIFSLGDETIYLRKHRVRRVERMTKKPEFIHHVREKD